MKTTYWSVYLWRNGILTGEKKRLFNNTPVEGASVNACSNIQNILTKQCIPHIRIIICFKDRSTKNGAEVPSV